MDYLICRKLMDDHDQEKLNENRLSFEIDFQDSLILKNNVLYLLINVEEIIEYSKT